MSGLVSRLIAGSAMAAGDGRSYTSFTARLAFMVSRFGGQYIAMIDGRVAAHCRDAKQVYDRARRVHPKSRIFLGQVPTRQPIVLFSDGTDLSLEFQT